MVTETRKQEIAVKHGVNGTIVEATQNNMAAENISAAMAGLPKPWNAEELTWAWDNIGWSSGAEPIDDATPIDDDTTDPGDVVTADPTSGEKGLVTLTSNPTRAQIYLEGVPRGWLTPQSIEIAVGQHNFTVKKAGYHGTSIKVDVQANGISERHVLLVNSRVPAPDVVEAVGVLKLTSRPSRALIKIAGTDIGLITPETLQLPVGGHNITCEAAGFEPVTKSVNVAQGIQEVYYDIKGPTVSKTPKARA